MMILLMLSFAWWTAPQAAPIQGFADLHNHIFAEYSHGGGWLHGTVEGELSRAMASCELEFDPFAIFGSHARVKIPFISTLIGRTRGSSGDTGAHLDKSEGYPHFTGWPRWDTIGHQQNWEGYLKIAHERGLNLTVLSMVNFEPLCKLIPEKNKKYPDCSDRAAIDRQITAAREFEKSHPWFKIVTSPLEARTAIQTGRMAVVLSIEVSNLFGDGDWRAELDRMYAQGVRTFQPVHQLNNRFGGAAIHNFLFRAAQWWFDYTKNAHGLDKLMPWKFGFDLTPDHKNKLGLTDEGRQLIQEMMKRGMLIDLAHLSEQSVRDTRELTLANRNYPVYISHGHFKEAMDDGKFSVFEKSSTPWVLEYIKNSGGIFGLRTGPEKTKAHPHSKAANDCQGSSKSFAQTYQYGSQIAKIPVAFGTDLNGFIQQTRPRFGNPDETCGAEENEVEQARQRRIQAQPLKRRFDQSGFGDISQVADIIDELKHFGVDTRNLESSAEAFIRMWEKAQH